MNINLTALDRKHRHAAEISELQKKYQSELKTIHDQLGKQDDAIERRYLEAKKDLQDKTRRALLEHETRYSRLMRKLDEKYAEKGPTDELKMDKKAGNRRKKPSPRNPYIAAFRGTDGGWVSRIEDALLLGPESFIKTAREAISSGCLTKEDVKEIYNERCQDMPIKDDGSGRPLSAQRHAAVSSIIGLPQHPRSSRELHHNSYWRDQRN